MRTSSSWGRRGTGRGEPSSNTPRVLVVAQPKFPVPPFRDGAAAMVIFDTLCCSPRGSALAVSFWDGDLVGWPARGPWTVIRPSLRWRLIRALFRRRYPQLATVVRQHAESFLLAGVWREAVRWKPDAVVVHSTKAEWIVNIKQCLPRRPVIAYHHSSEGHCIPAPLLLEMARRIDAHFFVCSHAAQGFLNAVKSLDSTIRVHVEVVRSGVDLAKFRPNPVKRERFRGRLFSRIGNAGSVIVGFVGRLVERKGLHVLIDAMRSLPLRSRAHVLLAIAGGPEYGVNDETAYVSAVRTQVAAASLHHRVAFLGYLPHETIDSFYAACDLVVIPSVAPEGLPLTALEAQAAGVPVIATRVGGLPEAIRDGETGVLVDPERCPGALTSVLDQLVSDEHRRREMGAHARRWAETAWSRERMAADFWSAVGRLLDRAVKKSASNGEALCADRGRS